MVPTAVQTLMAPYSVCALGGGGGISTPHAATMFPFDFVLSIITDQHFHYCLHGTRKKKEKGVEEGRQEQRPVW